jgi:hypothetical protein
VVNPSGQPARMNFGSGPGETVPSGRFTIGQSTTAATACDFIYVTRGVSFTASIANTCPQRIFLNPRLAGAATLTMQAVGTSGVPIGTVVNVQVLNEGGSILFNQVFTAITPIGPTLNVNVALPSGGLYEVRITTSAAVANYTYIGLNF